MCAHGESLRICSYFLPLMAVLKTGKVPYDNLQHAIKTFLSFVLSENLTTRLPYFFAIRRDTNVLENSCKINRLLMAQVCWHKNSVYSLASIYLTKHVFKRLFLNESTRKHEYIHEFTYTETPSVISFVLSSNVINNEVMTR